MSEAVIFGIGGILFIFVTWATIAFLLTRVMALEEQDSEGSIPANEVSQ